MTSRKSAFSLVLPLLLSAAITDAARAAGDVTEIHTTRVPAVPFSYTVDGFTYFWGMGDNELMMHQPEAPVRLGHLVPVALLVLAVSLVLMVLQVQLGRLVLMVLQVQLGRLVLMGLQVQLERLVLVRLQGQLEWLVFPVQRGRH